MDQIILSTEQQEVHDNLILWLEDSTKGKNPQIFTTVAGLAGTGKTTLMGFLADTIREKFNWPIGFCTYTGKASVVLRSKLNGKKDRDFCGTIHSMIYQPIIVNGEVVDWKLKPELPYDVIIIDEASMVNGELWEHLMTYGIPIIAIGDHGQLPPIGKINFNLMEDPDQILEEIHRQALDNPIIKLSMMVRNGQYIKCGNYGLAAKFTRYKANRFLGKLKVDPDTICLCGVNKTRVKINELLRENHGFTRKQPYAEEKVICLKNNRDLGIMNGMTGYVRKLIVTSDETYELTVDVDGGYRIRTIVYGNIFGKVKYDTAFEDASHPRVKQVLRQYQQKHADLFDFGYCISVHKSQGSEWERVVLFDERNFYQTDDDYTRWLYTGITRARTKLLIIEED